LGSNFNPQNTLCIPAVKILARLELEKIFRFSSMHYLKITYGQTPQQPILASQLLKISLLSASSWPSGLDALRIWGTFLHMLISLPR